MQVNYTTANGRLSVQLEASGHTDLWQKLSSFQEIFEESKCRKCDNEDLKFVIRKAASKDGKKEYTYHELHCRNPKCRAKMHFGVINDDSGNMFPKRKDDDGEWLPDGGWVKYNRETGKEE